MEVRWTIPLPITHANLIGCQRDQLAHVWAGRRYVPSSTHLSSPAFNLPTGSSTLLAREADEPTAHPPLSSPEQTTMMLLHPSKGDRNSTEDMHIVHLHRFITTYAGVQHGLSAAAGGSTVCICSWRCFASPPTICGLCLRNAGRVQTELSRRW